MNKNKEKLLSLKRELSNRVSKINNDLHSRTTSGKFSEQVLEDRLCRATQYWVARDEMWQRIRGPSVKCVVNRYPSSGATPFDIAGDLFRSCQASEAVLIHRR